VWEEWHNWVKEILCKLFFVHSFLHVLSKQYWSCVLLFAAKLPEHLWHMLRGVNI
jgi:hypothetical protein